MMFRVVISALCFLTTQPRKEDEKMCECYDELELFRDMLIDEFLRLCNYNDYNKLTLLKIGDVVDKCFDKSIETIQNMRKEDEGK